ncbi:putative transposase of IS4/5 family DUF4096 [Lentzea flaviverrucosa]|uniref:Putative transposase of IS4/5 family n=1 Tax=Lentzea flaviverrucosa TaxID=200379 RepID=A0A1H9XTX7_9PSEU|nr:putative transposase of IS4/5 family DUF4096 [Lentzea flaviverrucosa]SES49123.1 Putative transposase of IS4/5 family [Lentzea flaviverrucosa]
MGQSPPWIVSDDLWERIEPLLPVVPRRPRKPGRKRVSDRQVLCGILFVLHTGIQWEFLPQELGFGSGMTCWRRLRDWNEAGVWSRLHEVLLAELHSAGRLGWDRAVIDTSYVRAARRGPKAGRARSTAPAGLQAPRPDRRRRHPARGPAHRRQPQRRHRSGAAAGRGAQRARQTGPAPPTPDDRLRRPRLRPRQVPQAPARQGNHASDRSPRRASRLRPGNSPLGRGAHDRLVPRHETPTHPLGTPRRHP